MGGAPVGAVHKEHVGALGLRYRYARKVLGDVAAGIVHVACQHLAQLVRPLVALGLVGSDEGVHGEHVHGVVVAEAGFFLDAVPPPVVVHDVVAADEARQVEGLGGRVHGGGALAGVGADGLGGNVLVLAQDDVRPDLVGDDEHIVLLVQRHGLLQLPALPHPAAGVVGAAEDGGVDVLFFQVLLHVGKVHPPHTLLILHER